MKTKGLSNLIWIWDIQDIPEGGKGWEEIWSAYKPKSHLWDLMAVDIYDGSGYSSNKYEAMRKVSDGKPIAVGECQALPSPQILESQPEWAFFMGWAELTYEKNSESAIKATYTSPRVLKRDNMPGWNP